MSIALRAALLAAMAVIAACGGEDEPRDRPPASAQASTTTEAQREPPPAETKMTRARFWELIDSTRRGAGEDPGDHAAFLVEELATLDERQIVGFDTIWRKLTARAYTWDLWAAAYVMNGGCSDDCFTDFRDYLVSLGPDVYERALDDPDSLAELEIVCDGTTWEVFLGVRDQAYEDLTGGPLPQSRVTTPDEPAGEPWDEETGEVERRVPRLAAKCG